MPSALLLPDCKIPAVESRTVPPVYVLTLLRITELAVGRHGE